MNADQKRQQQKQSLCDQLQKTPIVQLACEKLGIGRATFYRWRKEDEEFARNADESLCEGVKLMNDMAESQLLSAIKNQNMTAIIFWLKNRHRSYAQRVEVTAKLEDKELSEEQREMVQKALTLGGLFPITNTHITNTHKK
jgi:hypothetical protein